METNRVGALPECIGPFRVFLKKSLDSLVRFRYDESMSNTNTTREAMRAINARQEREMMRSGVVLRAHTIPNKKRQANRNACKKGNWA